MALSYEFTKGRDKSISNEECYAVCMWLMVCGVSEVTVETLPTIENRIKVISALDGAKVPGRAQLTRFVGLKTNVGNERASVFMKKIAPDLRLPQEMTAQERSKKFAAALEAEKKSAPPKKRRKS